MESAENAILTFTQKEMFAEELLALKSNSCIKSNSSIRKLDPVLIGGLVHVGGRLSRSSMPTRNKHPVILPEGHHVSELILQQIHTDLNHAGRNYMLSSLRQNYWLIKARSAIRFQNVCIANDNILQ